MAAEPHERAECIWQETLGQPGVHIFVSDVRDRIAATCMLITAPNLLRSGRRHGFLENVVTHPDLRGCGHGRAVIQAALACAWASDCHHVLGERTHGCMPSTKNWASCPAFGSPMAPSV
jgi:GNAT superfamily N-acetyltransferase